MPDLWLLGTFNANTGEYEPLLAESWETDKADPRIWYFHLRHGLKRQHDGKELAADDVVHSIDRTKRDPRTAQVNNVHPIASAEASDQFTVKITTTEPAAPLLDYIFDRLIITGKDLFDKFTARRSIVRRHMAGAHTRSGISLSVSAWC